MKITDEFWDFIEKYIPDYTKRDDVLQQAGLQNYIDGHESDLSEEMSKDEAEDELRLILYNLYHEAIDNFTKGIGVECERCNSERHNYCSHCGKPSPQNQNTEDLKAKHIEEIKTIINQYGEFSTACVMADSSPIVRDDNYTTQLAEKFSADKVTLVTYSKETDQEIGEDHLPYDKLTAEVLADIHSLAIQWKGQNESLRP